MHMHLTPLELLAPARNTEIARQAILHGADAVYIGGPSHGARAAAANSVEDISTLTDFAHIYGAKVYVTLNTVVYDTELYQVKSTITELYDAGVDALIIQDMGLMMMDLPPIDLHASTQCDIRTPEKARFLAEAGFSQLVLPREFSLSEIREARAAVPDHVKLEAFVHGALCVSYSGDCQASLLAKGRSANRGECAQMCRLAYSLTDENGHTLIRDKYLLSLRDLCRIRDLEALANAGISSFKIEGRLKDMAYVKNVTAAYRKAIDEVISRNPAKYSRASHGRINLSFTPDLEKTFNRGYTSYFINANTPNGTRMANHDTPKWVGERVATVVRCDGKSIITKPVKPLNNGDGLAYFAGNGKYTGFHLNRTEGNTLHTLTPMSIPRGTTLYRNRDAKFETLMASDTASRLLAVNARLRESEPGIITLTLTAENGISASASIAANIDNAKTPQLSKRRKEIGKTGDTPFVISEYTDEIPDTSFIAASILSHLRRNATEALRMAILNEYKRQRRIRGGEETATEHYPYPKLSYHDNVANSLAQEFYSRHGADTTEKALEVDAPSSSETTVMTTRYCLRRELGCCLKEKGGNTMPRILFLTNDTASYRLDFDCNKCQMHVVFGKFMLK